MSAAGISVANAARFPTAAGLLFGSASAAFSTASFSTRFCNGTI